MELIYKYPLSPESVSPEFPGSLQSLVVIQCDHATSEVTKKGYFFFEHIDSSLLEVNTSTFPYFKKIGKDSFYML